MPHSFGREIENKKTNFVPQQMGNSTTPIWVVSGEVEVPLFWGVRRLPGLADFLDSQLFVDVGQCPLIVAEPTGSPPIRCLAQKEEIPQERCERVAGQPASID